MLISQKDAVRYSGICVQTLRAYAKCGVLRAIDAGREVLYSTDELDALLSGCPLSVNELVRGAHDAAYNETDAAFRLYDIEKGMRAADARKWVSRSVETQYGVKLHREYLHVCAVAIKKYRDTGMEYEARRDNLSLVLATFGRKQVRSVRMTEFLKAELRQDNAQESKQDQDVARAFIDDFCKSVKIYRRENGDFTGEFVTKALKDIAAAMEV